MLELSVPHAQLPRPRQDRILDGADGIGGDGRAARSLQRQLEAARVEGRIVRDFRLAEISDSLAALPLEERRAVPGLHPDRAPTIVAGMILLAQVLGAFRLDRFEASERDILWGAALASALET